MKTNLFYRSLAVRYLASMMFEDNWLQNLKEKLKVERKLFKMLDNGSKVWFEATREP